MSRSSSSTTFSPGDMRSSALLFFCLFETSWTLNSFCVHQPKTIFVKSGKAVTIPCAYTYDTRWKEPHIRVSWWETDGPHCSPTNKTIIDHSGIVIEKYKGRLSRVKDPERNRTESITIRGLIPSDGRIFCCSATLSHDGKDVYTWQDVYGTILDFADGKVASQFDDLIAVPGEPVTIPCYYPLEITGEAYQVIWDSKCSSCWNISNGTTNTWKPVATEKNFQFSLVNFPKDVSLRVHNHSRRESSFYRCSVSTNIGSIDGRLGTELTVAGSSSSSSLMVTQPYNTSGHRGESVTLRCSYTPYLEGDVLGVNIYWRVGNISGPYVYHPYEEMVHPSYRGRTEIIGAADLHIQDLQMSDASMYYCFVMIRLCMMNDVHRQDVDYGEGTRLLIADRGQTEFILQVITATYITMKLLVMLAVWISTLIDQTQGDEEEEVIKLRLT